MSPRGRFLQGASSVAARGTYCHVTEELFVPTQHRRGWGGWGAGGHPQEHRPQRPTERSDPTQHAEGRPGDCPGPRKETATRRNVPRGWGGVDPPPPPSKRSPVLDSADLVCSLEGVSGILGHPRFSSVGRCFAEKLVRQFVGTSLPIWGAGGGCITGRPHAAGTALVAIANPPCIRCRLPS